MQHARCALSQGSPHDHATFDVEQDRPGRLRLWGELDLAGVPVICDRLLKVDGDVELDCEGLTFIDAAGVRLFLEVQAGCEARGVKLSIVNPARCLIRVVELTGLGGRLDVRAEGSAA